MPKKKRVAVVEKTTRSSVYNIRLDDDMIERLDEQALRRGGIGRAAVVRMALVEYLDREEKR